MADIMGAFNRPMDFGVLMKQNDVSPATQSHLAHVYGTLGLAMAATVGGIFAQLKYSLAGSSPQLAGLACLGMMLWLAFDSDKTNQTKRTAILAGFGFFKGLALSPLIAMAIKVDVGILVTACLASLTVFVAFSLSALISKRRSYLYLGGMLSSALGWLCIASLLNIFFKTSFIPLVNLYLGLAIFCGYVIFDTQMIIEKAEGGDRDAAWHAMELYIDLIGIFVRILVILLRNSEKKKNSRQSNRR